MFRPFLLGAAMLLASGSLAWPVSAALAPDTPEQGVGGAAMKVKPEQPNVEEIIVRGLRDRALEKQRYHEMLFREHDLIYGAQKARVLIMAAGFVPDAGGIGAAGASPIQERASSAVAAMRSAPSLGVTKAVLGE
jgi:hypothetical protein